MQKTQSADSNPVMETRKLEVVKELPAKAAGGGLLGDSVTVHTVFLHFALEAARLATRLSMA